MSTVMLAPHNEKLLLKLGIPESEWSVIANAGISKYLRETKRYGDNEADFPEATYICIYCNRRFKSKRSLNVHITNTHKKEHKPTKCELCGRIFDSHYGLAVHLAKTHNIEKERENHVLKAYWCSKCNSYHMNNSELGIAHINYKHENSDELVREHFRKMQHSTRRRRV